MHDRGPWPKGSTVYGLTDFSLNSFILSLVSRNHLCGLNEFGSSKYSGSRQITWFCVTTTVWNILEIRFSLKEYLFSYTTIFKNKLFIYE